MKNRAKCKLCKDVIESRYEGHTIHCQCGEIYVDGGPEKLLCGAFDWKNFLRVDDEGNEILVTLKDGEVKQSSGSSAKTPDKQELLKMLDRMIDSIEGLPPQAMQSYINHYDFCSALILIRSILRS